MSDFLHSVRFESFGKFANGLPADEVLRDICTAFEQHVPGTTAGVTILDRTAQLFEHAIFPSLSPEYAAALQGIVVKDKPGSCALAVFEGQTVVVEDVSSDERFSALWKSLGASHGLRSLVSIPAFHRDGITLGTFVVAWQQEAPLSDDQMRLAEEYATLCALALTFRRTQLKHELLVGELQHRMRNMFSTIGAVVYSTLKAHPEPAIFRKVFDGRLLAFSRAHSLALETGTPDLRSLLVDTLAPYSIDHEVTIEGPQLILSQEAAVAFSLAAHELATNAAKYGALSRDGGCVRISWMLANDDAPSFELNWNETGGPEVQSPEREGYGQKTLKRSLSAAFDGAIDLTYDPGGLMCRVKAPYTPRLGTRAM